MEHNSQMTNALLVVAKKPAAGQTKTRLTPPLSPQKASALYECFLIDTINLIRQLPDTQRVIAYLPDGEEAYFGRLAPDFQFIRQRGSGLGSRLDNATTHYLKLGYKRVIVMDSDSPTLPVAHLIEAFTALESEHNDIVIGPCDDGGYYLIGLKQPAPRLLREVQMSTPSVTSDTLKIAAQEGLRVHILPTWYDVDDEESLERLRNELAQLPENIAFHTRKFFSLHKPEYNSISTSSGQ